MEKFLNPQDFGLNKRIKLIQISENNIGIVKKRKSRIIMKDGVLLADIASQIKASSPKSNVSILISGPICSKTIKFLNDYSITVLKEE